MNIKPISYMKANAANLSTEIGLEPLFVTQNGVDTLVVQSSEAYKAQQEKMAFMELLIKSEKILNKVMYQIWMSFWILYSYGDYF